LNFLSKEYRNTEILYNALVVVDVLLFITQVNDMQKTHLCTRKTGCYFCLRFVPVVLFLFTVILPIHVFAMERQTIHIPMRDGKKLAADLYLPNSDPNVEWPTILIQTPYNRIFYRFDGLPLTTDDYAFVIVDWRGFWGSKNAATPNTNRGEDGYDCVEWIAQQSWSDGHVGTWGLSALGGVQWETAREQPPHLDACVPMVRDYFNHYEMYYPGGVLLEKHVAFLDDYYGMGKVIYPHPTHDWLWRFWEGSTSYANKIGVPMLVVGGWYDYNPEGSVRSFNAIVSRSQSDVRDDHRLLMGPWRHGGIDKVEQGELKYPEAAGAHEEAALAFLDFWVRGVGEGLTGDPVRWFDMGRHEWAQSSQWPPADASEKVVYLKANGVLSTNPPVVGSSSTKFPYDPERPSPTIGGALHKAFGEKDLGGPYDISVKVESRPDAIIFTIPVLPTDVTIAGPTVATLFASSDRRDTDFMVRLTDVYPDGRSMIITDGARRGRFRNGFDREKLMTPGEVYQIEVELADTAITFLKGHQIRIVISSSNWPRFQANPNDGGPLNNDHATLLVAHNRIYHDVDHPSHITFMVMP